VAGPTFANRLTALTPDWLRRRWGAAAASAAVLAATLGFFADIQGLIFGSTMSAAEAEMLADRVAIRMDTGAASGDELADALHVIARDGSRRERDALEMLDAGDGQEALDRLDAEANRLLRRHPELAAQRLVQLGVIAEGVDSGRAIDFYRRALDTDPALLRALNRLGDAYARTGLPEEAGNVHTEALNRARETGNVREEIAALAGLGALDSNTGRYDQADARYEAALELADSVGDLRLSANMLGNRGYVAQGRGEPEAARSFYTRALSLFESADDPVGAALARNNLANFERESGEFDTAADNYRIALAALESAGRRPLGALVLQNLGSTAEDRGDFDQAARFYRRALERAREYDYVRFIQSSARRLAWVEMQRRNAAEAIILGEEALQAAERMGDDAAEADARVLLIGANGETGHHDAARSHAMRAFELFDAVDAPPDTRGYVHSALGLMAFRDGNAAEALVQSRLARAAYAEAGLADETAEQDRRLATLAMERGETEAACAHLANARELYQQSGNSDALTGVETRRAELGCTPPG